MDIVSSNLTATETATLLLITQRDVTPTTNHDPKAAAAKERLEHLGLIFKVGRYGLKATGMGEELLTSQGYMLPTGEVTPVGRDLLNAHSSTISECQFRLIDQLLS